MKPPNQILITSTRVEEGHHDRVTVWNRGANAGTLTVQAGDGAEVAARLMGARQDVPFEARPTGGGDFDEVCTICEEALAEPHTYEACARRLAQTSRGHLDEACTALGQLSEARARIAELETSTEMHGDDDAWPLHDALARAHEFALMLASTVAERDAALARVAELEAAAKATLEAAEAGVLLPIANAIDELRRLARPEGA